MDDAGQGRQRAEFFEDSRRVGSNRDVGFERHDPRAALLELMQVLASVFWNTSAAEQRQVARAVIHQPPGELQAKTAESTGDQVGRVGAQLDASGAGRARRFDQARHQALAASQRNLVFGVRAGDLTPQRLDRGRAAIGIDVDPNPRCFRVLQRQRSRESPHRGLGKRHVLHRARGLGAARHDGDPGRRAGRARLSHDLGQVQQACARRHGGVGR